MNAKILLAGEYTDKVIVKSNFINGNNCTIDDGIIFSHVEGKDSSISSNSNYSHVDGVSSSIGTNSERGHIIGNKSNITDSANSIIIGQYSNITKSPNSIVLGNASIEPPINGVENNIVIGSNTKVTSGSNNIIIGSHSSTTDVSPSRENCIYLYTPNGMDDIYINDNKLSELTNAFGMRDVYTTLQDNNGISFVTSKDASVEYTTVSAVSSKAPVFDLHEARKILVKDYSESELANSDSPLYSASIGYVDRKFDGIGVDGVSLSLTDSTSADYFIVSFDKTAGSGIYATLNASIVDNNSSEYHYNFGFELHYVNDSVGISSDTYILNTNNINLFKDKLSVVYTTDYENKINVYIRVSSNPSVQNISLNITVKHTAQSNAIFKKLEKLTNAISGTQVGLLFTNKSILQSSGNTFEVDFTSSTRVKAKTVSLSNSIIDSYKNDVVTCGLLKEVKSNVVTLSDGQTITGTKTFSGECYVKSVDIKTNLNTDKAVSCKSLNQYLTGLGLNSNSTYVTIGTEQTITGKKTFTGEATFNNYIYGNNANGLNIINKSNTSALRLYGGNGTNGGARLMLDGKGADTKGAWSIRASDGTENKFLYGTKDRLSWGNDRVLTEIADLNPILSKIKEIEKTIGLINKTLEDNVGNFTSSQPNTPQPSPVDKLEQIYDNTYVYICDRTINYYTPTKTVNVGQECTLLGLATCENWCSSLIKCGSNVFLKSKAYDIVTKKSTISPTTLTLSCQGTYDWYAAAAAVLCYEKNINVEQHFINRNGATGDRTNTKSIVINKDAVLVMLCGSGTASSTYIAINGQIIISTNGISNAHRVMQVDKNTTVELHCEGSSAWWAFAHIFVLTPS